MKFAPLFAVALALLPGCRGREERVDDGSIAPSAKVDLFNGKDFSGWKLFMKDGSDPAKVWSIANGVIKCVGSPNGYMRTEKTYRDYKVTVEWRFITPGNTGVMVHMGLPDKVWPRSFECQGMSKHQGDFWMWEGADCKEPKIPGKNGFTKTAKSNENAPGEWNTYEVACVGSTIKIYVNGKLMNTATKCNASSGFIGLQSEGAEMEVRKVTIEPAGK